MAEEKKKSKLDVFSAGTTDDEKKKRFEAGAIVAMGSFLAGGLFQVLWMTILPRQLGAQDMGLFSPLMFAFYGMATLLALGIPQTIVTFVSKHYEHEFEESLKFIVDGMRLLFQIAIGVAIVVIIIMIALGLAGIVEWIWVAMACVFMFAITQAAIFWGLNAILNGFQRLDLVSIGNIVFPIGIFAASISLVAAAQSAAGAESRWDVVGAVGGLGLGHTCAWITALIVVKKTKLVPIKDLFSFKSAYGMYGKILKFGGLAAVAFVAMTLVQNLTPAVVRFVGMRGLFFGDTPKTCEVAIGHFGTAMIFGMAAMLITGIAIAIIPAISEAEDRKRHDLMQHYYTTALSQSFMILGVFILLFATIGGAIIELMNGAQFKAEIMQPLGILATVGGAGVALLFVLINLYTGLKKPLTPAIITIIVLIVMTAAIAALCFTRDIRMPMFGFIVPVWIGNIAIMVFARRDFGLRFEPRTILEPIVAGIGPVLIVLFAIPKPSPMPEMAWVLGADLVILLGPYSLILWLFDRRRKKYEKPPEE